jgi:hypothetical protein
MSNKKQGLAAVATAGETRKSDCKIDSENNVSTNAVKLANKVARVLVKGAWRSALPMHPAAERIPEATDAEKRRLAGDLDQRGQQMRVVLVRVAGGHQQLLDGRTRLDLLEGLGTEVVNATGNVLVPHDIIDVASDAEAEAISLSLNLHRRHLTREQTRKLVIALIKAQPEKSDRHIAEQAKSNRTTVGQIRKTLEKAGHVSIVDTRTDTKGRKQPAKKKAAGADGKARKQPAKKKTAKPKRSTSQDRRELEAKQAHIDELEAAREHDQDLAERLRAAEIKIAGLESEVEELKAENKKLREQLEAAQKVAA